MVVTSWRGYWVLHHNGGENWVESNRKEGKKKGRNRYLGYSAQHCSGSSGTSLDIFSGTLVRYVLLVWYQARAWGMVGHANISPAPPNVSTKRSCDEYAAHSVIRCLSGRWDTGLALSNPRRSSQPASLLIIKMD